MDDVHCTGTECTLFDWPHLKRDNCGSHEGAGVVCICELSPTTSIELQGGSSSNEGNLFVNNRPICDDHWDDNDATVACRMLGYNL